MHVYVALRDSAAAAARAAVATASASAAGRKAAMPYLAMLEGPACAGGSTDLTKPVDT